MVDWTLVSMTGGVQEQQVAFIGKTQEWFAEKWGISVNPEFSIQVKDCRPLKYSVCVGLSGEMSAALLKRKSSYRSFATD